MIVLDTHTLIWWVTGVGAELTKTVTSAIKRSQAQNGVMISSITAWEIAMLVDRNRLTLTLELSAWLSLVTRVPGIRFIPVDNHIAVTSVNLPGEFHEDPADRIIVATARTFGAPIATRDRRIRSYEHVKTIW
jgi:PIN domain nuclease of toxin-antitoxin system